MSTDISEHVLEYPFRAAAPPSMLLCRLPTLELAVATEALPRREGLLIGGLDRVLVRW